MDQRTMWLIGGAVVIALAVGLPVLFWDSSLLAESEDAPAIGDPAASDVEFGQPTTGTGEVGGTNENDGGTAGGTGTTNPGNGNSGGDSDIPEEKDLVVLHERLDKLRDPVTGRIESTGAVNAELLKQLRDLKKRIEELEKHGPGSSARTTETGEGEAGSAESEETSTAERTGSGRAFFFRLQGQVDTQMLNAFERQLSARLQREEAIDFIVIEIDTWGGFVDSGVELANLIDTLPGRLGSPKPKIVGFVKKKAISAGALLALACEKLYMRSTSTFGGAAPVGVGNGEDKEARALGEKVQSPIRKLFKAYAEKQGYPTSLAMAMVSDDLEVLEILLNDGTVRYPLASELTTNWTEEERSRIARKRTIIKEGELCTLTGQEAEEYGYASVAETREELLADLARKNRLSQVVRVGEDTPEGLFAADVSLRLCSILVSGRNRKAIFEVISHDFGTRSTKTVGVGERLPDGTVLKEIENNHVVISHGRRSQIIRPTSRSEWYTIYGHRFADRNKQESGSGDGTGTPTGTGSTDEPGGGGVPGADDGAAGEGGGGVPGEADEGGEEGGGGGVPGSGEDEAGEEQKAPGT